MIAPAKQLALSTLPPPRRRRKRVPPRPPGPAQTSGRGAGRLEILLSPPEKARLKRAAAAAGLHVAELVRDAVIEHIERLEGRS